MGGLHVISAVSFLEEARGDLVLVQPVAPLRASGTGNNFELLVKDIELSYVCVRNYQGFASAHVNGMENCFMNKQKQAPGKARLGLLPFPYFQKNQKTRTAILLQDRLGT